MKIEQTFIIEKVLLRGCFGANPKLAIEYGTSEVTIGFQRNGNGKEIVDYQNVKRAGGSGNNNISFCPC